MELAGARISTARKAQHHTQSCLAEKSGIHVNYLSLIERAKREASIDIYRCIADALGIPMWQLFCDVSSEALSILQVLEDCSENELRMLGCLLHGLKSGVRQNNMLEKQ